MTSGTRRPRTKKSSGAAATSLRVPNVVARRSAALLLLLLQAREELDEVPQVLLRKRLDQSLGHGGRAALSRRDFGLGDGDDLLVRLGVGVEQDQFLVVVLLHHADAVLAFLGLDDDGLEDGGDLR